MPSRQKCNRGPRAAKAIPQGSAKRMPRVGREAPKMLPILEHPDTSMCVGSFCCAWDLAALLGVCKRDPEFRRERLIAALLSSLSNDPGSNIATGATPAGLYLKDLQGDWCQENFGRVRSLRLRGNQAVFHDGQLWTCTELAGGYLECGGWISQPNSDPTQINWAMGDRHVCSWRLQRHSCLYAADALRRFCLGAPLPALGKIINAMSPTVLNLAQRLLDSGKTCSELSSSVSSSYEAVELDLVGERALCTLLALGTAAVVAVPCFAHALNHKDPYVRAVAVHALHKLRELACPAASRLASIVMNDVETDIRKAALRVLIDLRSCAVPGVANFMQALRNDDEDRHIRLRAAHALYKLRRVVAFAVPELASMVLRSSGTPDTSPTHVSDVEQVWAATLRVLVRLDAAAAPAVQVFADALSDHNAHVRFRAAFALQKLALVAAPLVPDLAWATLHGSDESVRTLALRALASLRFVAVAAGTGFAQQAMFKDAEYNAAMGPKAMEALRGLGEVGVAAIILELSKTP